MNLTVWAWVGLAILAVAPFVTYGLGRSHAHAEGKHRRTCHDLEAELEQRHADWLASVRVPRDELDMKLPAWPDFLRQELGHTAADSIGPVVVPEPKLTDTGELRAIDERMEAFRRAMVTGETAFRAKSQMP